MSKQAVSKQSVSVEIRSTAGGALHVRETPRVYSETEARDALEARRAELSSRNPACEFVTADSGLTLYWRCADGFDYGLYSYTLDGRIALVWDGHTSLLWRRWRPDADESTQIAADPHLPRMPARPDAWADDSESL